MRLFAGRREREPDRAGYARIARSTAASIISAAGPTMRERGFQP